jgi:hypothetical protein
VPAAVRAAQVRRLRERPEQTGAFAGDRLRADDHVLRDVRVLRQGDQEMVALVQGLVGQSLVGQSLVEHEDHLLRALLRLVRAGHAQGDPLLAGHRAGRPHAGDVTLGDQTRAGEVARAAQGRARRGCRRLVGARAGVLVAARAALRHQPAHARHYGRGGGDGQGAEGEPADPAPVP